MESLLKMAKALKHDRNVATASGKITRPWGRVAYDWLFAPRSRELRATLKPYGPAIRVRKSFQILLILGALFFCFVYGFAFALMAPFIVLPFAIPLLILAALVLWALPEVNRAPKMTLEVLLFVYFTVFALWPNYLAIVLPGLPWITLSRLFGASLILVLLICISMSAEFRRRLADVLKAAPLLSRFIGLFLIMQAISIFLSTDKAESINIFLNVLTGWIAPFVASSFILSRRARAERFAALLCFTAVALSTIAVWEHRLGKMPWVGHIPSFLQVNDPSVQLTLQGTSRDGQEHRVQGTFSTSLAFSEYMAITLPFLLNFAFGRFPMLTRIAALLAIPLVVGTIVMTQSRTGMIGVLVALSVYPLVRVFLFWRRNRQSLVASSALFLTPVAVALALMVCYVVPGLHNRIFGGGRDASSNDSRTIQIHMGTPKVLARPWGYGIGMGSDTLQYSGSGNGVYSIDVFPLRLLLEYGVLGTAIYYGMVFSALYYGFKAVLESADQYRERSLFIPLALVALGYTFMQIYYAMDDNQPVMYALYGALLAMTYRRACERRAEAVHDGALRPRRPGAR